MPLYYSEDGFPFKGPPYTDEENCEFEERLRRGGDITIIRRRQPDCPEPSPNAPEQHGRRHGHGTTVVEEERIGAIIGSIEREK